MLIEHIVASCESLSIKMQKLGHQTTLTPPIFKHGHAYCTLFMSFLFIICEHAVKRNLVAYLALNTV